MSCDERRRGRDRGTEEQRNREQGTRNSKRKSRLCDLPEKSRQRIHVRKEARKILAKNRHA
jgi:hypothetical protein